MGERMPSCSTLICFLAAFLCCLVAVFLIPGAIESRTLANTAYFSLALGLVLLMAGGALALDRQDITDQVHGNLVVWHLVTITSWAIVVPNILFLFAFAIVATQVGALEERDEAWDILIPQAVTAIVLTMTLLALTPWTTPKRASGVRRLASVLPAAIVVVFWYWWANGR